MYLTAHRVTNPSDGRTGINSFLHEHQRDLHVSQSWGESEVNKIANQDPGALIAENTELPPGGNRVLSYLEVIFEDSTPLHAVQSVLNEFMERASTESFFNKNGIVVLFHLVQRLHGHEIIESASLVDAALGLLETSSSPLS